MIETHLQNNELKQGEQHLGKYKILVKSIIGKYWKILLGETESQYIIDESKKKTFPETTRGMKEEKGKRIPKLIPEIHLSINQKIPKIEATIAKILELQKDLGITLPEKRIRESIYFLIRNSYGNLEISDDMLLRILKMLGRRKDINFSEIKISRNIKEYEIRNFLETITDGTVLENTNHIGINTLFEWGRSGELIRQIQQTENTEEVINFWTQGDRILGEQRISFRRLIGYSINSRITQFALQCKTKGVDMQLFDTIEAYLGGLTNIKADTLRGDIRTFFIIEGKASTKNDIEQYLFMQLEEIKKILTVDNPQFNTNQESTELELKKYNEFLSKNSALIELPEIFNPQKELEKIRTLSAGEKRKAMEIWRGKLRNQLDIIIELPDAIKLEAEGYNYITTSASVIEESIIKKFFFLMISLSREQKEKILVSIKKYVERKSTIHRYFKNPKYRENPKLLITEVLGVNESEIKGSISMEIDGANFTFYVQDKDDYQLLHYGGDRELADKNPSSGGFATADAKIPELKGTISVINGAKTKIPIIKELQKNVQVHETRHMDNQILMSDFGIGDQLSRAKDEIIAYLKDGSSIGKIESILFDTGSSALYNYYAYLKEGDSERYKILQKAYITELSCAIDIVKRLQKANIPNYREILAITPIRQWSHLEDIYLNK